MILGSGELIHALLPHGLIDAFLLTIHPLVLGSGQRLFPTTAALARFKLVESKPTTTGVLITRYEASRNERSSPCSVWLVAEVISTSTSSPGDASPLKFTTLLWRVRPRRRDGVVARRALDEHLERPPHEPLRALARAPLDRPRRGAPCARRDTSCGRNSSANAAASVPRRGE